MSGDDLLSDWVEGLAERKERLAENLYDLVYGHGQWAALDHDDPDDEYVAEVKENYRKDAWDILLANPHLMDLEMRTNLAHLGLVKED